MTTAPKPDLPAIEARERAARVAGRGNNEALCALQDIPALLAEVKRQADALDAAERRIGDLEAKVQAERREFADAHRTYAAQLATMTARVRIAMQLCDDLLNGTRDPDARGMGKTLPCEYEMPPSTLKRVRKLVAAARAALGDGDGAGG